MEQGWSLMIISRYFVVIRLEFRNLSVGNLGHDVTNENKIYLGCLKLPRGGLQLWCTRPMRSRDYARWERDELRSITTSSTEWLKWIWRVSNNR